MKKALCCILLSALILGVFTSCFSKNTSRNSESTPTATEDYTLYADISNADRGKLSKIYDEKLDELGFEGFVYVIDNNEVLYDKGFGYADKKAKKKLNKNTVFRIASITKQFTSAAVLLLRERGKLSVKDKLSKYFPDCPYGDKVTLENLLQMRSGIPDYLTYEVLMKFFDNNKKLKNTAEENRKIILNNLLKQDLRFTPNEKNEYSNSNYFLLAEIIEKAGGTAYHKFLKKEIFDKLGMNSTDFSDNADKFKDSFAKPYNYKSEDIELFKIKGVDFGCADMISTAADLRKWADGLRENRVISVDSLKAMVKGRSGYGYGVNVADDGAAVYHSGSLPPYENAFFFSLKKPYYTCIVLGNYSFKMASSVLIRLSKEYLKNRI